MTLSDQQVAAYRRTLNAVPRRVGPGAAPKSDPETAEASLTFGKRARILRKTRRPDYEPLSQEKLADRAGCDRQSVNRVENAAYSPSLMRVFRLAKALRVHPALLFMTDDEAAAWHAAMRTPGRRAPAVD